MTLILNYPRDKNCKSIVIYFPKYSHLAIPAKMHCPKGDQINESLL